MKKIAFLGLIVICLFTFCKPHVKSENKVPAKTVVKAPSVPLDTFYDDLSALISGIPRTKTLFDTFQKSPFWANYSKSIDSMWKKIDTTRLQKMVKFANSELKNTKKYRTVFYPFGGPDFLHVFTFFPDADTFYLMGLEHVGNYPDFSKAKPVNVSYYLENLKISLSDIFGKSYFITKKMGYQLFKVEGVIPVISFFLERTGNQIVSVSKVDFNDQGKAIETPYKLHSNTNYFPCAVKIRFVNKNSAEIKTLYYISADLSDGSYHPDIIVPGSKFVNPATKLYRFIDNLPANCLTYVKSASYLLHYPFFSHIRGQVLEKSRCIVQDDTGIPYKYFDPKKWDVQLYGVYVKPIEDFKGLGMQADMKMAYADSTKVKPLPFNIGYHWRTKEDNLIYAQKK